MRERESITFIFDLREVAAYVETRTDDHGDSEHVLVIDSGDICIELVRGVAGAVDEAREGAVRIAHAAWRYSVGALPAAGTEMPYPIKG